MFERVVETMRYTYRLRPGASAVRVLETEWHRCRFIWNEAVHQQRTGGKPTLAKLGKLLTDARRRMVWLRDGSQVAQQQMLRSYTTALNQSFAVKGRGRPKVKRRKDSLPSLEYTRNGFSLADGRLRLPKGIVIPVVWSRDLPSTPTSVRVYQDSLGHWYASFVVRSPIEPLPQRSTGLGVDWGVSVTATTTNPDFDLPYGGNRKRCAAELARAQRKMARRRRPAGHTPSNGYSRARREAARLQKKAARQNSHAARVWANSVVREHQLIAIEGFKPKFLAQSSLAGKAADAAIGAAKRELLTRAKRAGRQVVIVEPAYTTMTCSSCFARAKRRLGLDERTFRCDSCGYIAGRDRNAAKVILAVAERGHTSVDDVRHVWHSSSGVVVCAV
ncbi:RNA-guided endonuclease InsQ/TnpB family protein [Nocardia sp. NPDC060259]|uniref:RNA-guided endonuclease InsQ/TnpB family protein n=1 Tax=Nocardia sp. NPDC060259 TaxID=3347088 RepID=UPI003659651E